MIPLCFMCNKSKEACLYFLRPFTYSVFLGKIKEAFDRNADLQNLLLDSFFNNAVQECQVNIEQ